MMKFNLFFFLGIIAFAGCSERNSTSHQKAIEDKPRLTGMWELVSMDAFDSSDGTWKTWNQGMQGYVLYEASGFMALHLSRKGYQNFQPSFPNFQDSIPLEALKHLTNSYHYFAEYEIDSLAQQVHHKSLAHSNPSEWNKKVTRKMEFKGDTLILKPVESKNAHLRVRWVKKTKP